RRPAVASERRVGAHAARRTDLARRVRDLDASRGRPDHEPPGRRRGPAGDVARDHATRRTRGDALHGRTRTRSRGDRMTPATPLVAHRMLGRQRLSDYLALTKPRVVLMVLITTFVGFYLGSTDRFEVWKLVHALTGTALAAGGTLALNQFMERRRDAH